MISMPILFLSKQTKLHLFDEQLLGVISCQKDYRIASLLYLDINRQPLAFKPEKLK